MRILSLLAFCLAAATACAVDLTHAIPKDCEQVVLVTARGWSSPTGTLRRFERHGAQGKWEPVGKPMDALLGQRGLGWGLGLHAPMQESPRKIEGDSKAPAGVFALGPAFGRAPRGELRWLRMPYRQLSPTTEAVDDPFSRYYNRVVDRSHVERPDWQSSEHMATVPDYELGVMIAHNPPKPLFQSGSCIFLHLWLGERNGTAGCTALHRPDLLELLRWLDAAKKPVLVQLPAKVAQESLSGF